MAKRTSKLSIEKALLFSFAVFFVIIMLILVVAIPYPTQKQWWVFRLVLAMIAGGFGAMLPGALEVSVNKTIKAAGAAGFFVVVYFFNPAGFVSDDPFAPFPPPPSSADAQKVAEKMLSEVNNGQFAELYESMHPEFKSMYNKDQFTALSNNVRVPFGKASKSTQFGTQSSKIYNPRGYILQYTYLSEFPDGSKIYESPTVFASDSSAWHPFGYMVQTIKSNH
ncbi:MAG TPA: DUF4019 domain-containing protein [Scandinavium sp.]|jgi:hypothetical protein|uniref:DUF4019 domain-containing protein n=1 Tax=Scandinavium sp. TaxID=2830653 RepID=UPI002E2EBC18|nr:DUF4019 domain-containing protein [Scandinavium sp.]HEX4500248.1 DUF4019 domain-containing protein [Scandinavium sp.]